MKKLLFSFVVIILSFIAYNQMQAQCQYCVAPKTCQALVINVPGCGDVEYTFCIECLVSARLVKVDIIGIKTTSCSSNLDIIWDTFYEYIYDHLAQVCGQVACDQGSTTLEVSHNLCMDYYWDGSRYNISYNSACDLKCVNTYLWCFCNCTPDCKKPPCPKPHHQSTKINSIIVGTGVCTHTIQDVIDKGKGAPWDEGLQCVSINCP